MKASRQLALLLQVLNCEQTPSWDKHRLTFSSSIINPLTLTTLYFAKSFPSLDSSLFPQCVCLVASSNLSRGRKLIWEGCTARTHAESSCPRFRPQSIWISSKYEGYWEGSRQPENPAYNKKTFQSIASHIISIRKCYTPEPLQVFYAYPQQIVSLPFCLHSG